MTTATYSIAGGQAGKSRLDVLAAMTAPTTLELLRRVGVPSGASCLDVGCGGGHVTLALARLAGPTGRVVGVDFDADIVELAAADAARDGIDTASFVVGDAMALDRTGLRGPFDVAYARFLLSHVGSPSAVVRQMVELVRPGGAVVIEDIDIGGALCDPPSDAFDRSIELYRAVVGRKGADAGIGPRLSRVLDYAGVADVDVSVVQLAGRDPGDPAKRIQTLTLDRIGPAVIDAGLATRSELEDLGRRLHLVAGDPRSLFCTPRIFQVWGRRRW